MTELEKLKKYLDDNGYISKWHRVLSENDQIIVYTKTKYNYSCEVEENAKPC